MNYLLLLEKIKARPRIGICQECSKRVVISEVRGDFIYCEFFTDDLCFKCFYKQKETPESASLRE